MLQKCVFISIDNKDSRSLDLEYTLQTVLFILKLIGTLMGVRFPNRADVSCPAIFFTQDSKEPAIHSPSTENQLTAILLKFMAIRSIGHTYNVWTSQKTSTE